MFNHKNYKKMKKFLLILAAIFCCTIGANAQTPDYFCITNVDASDGVVTFKKAVATGASYKWKALPVLEYSTDGDSWQNLEFVEEKDVAEQISINISANTSLYFRAGKDGTAGTNGHISENFNTGTYSSTYISIYSTKNITASGNIMSLLDGADFDEAIELSDKSCFAGLFYNCTKLMDVSALKLPATILTDYCYDSMFRGCSSLTAVPVLPAQTLASYCYNALFSGCTKLTSVTAYFLKWPSDVYGATDYCATNGWFTSVKTSGTFLCSSALPNTEFGANTIPTTWKRGEIVEPVDELIFNDADAYTAIYGKQGKLTYNRTFAEENIGNYEPLYVPFDIEITSEILDKCDIYDIYMVSKGSGDNYGKDVLNIRAMEVGETTEFHTPYIIMPKVTDFSFAQLNTIAHGVPAVQDTMKCSTTKDIYNFAGNYEGEITLEAGKGNYILGPTSLEPVSTTKTLVPNRWYMKKVSKKGEQPVGVDLKEMKIVVVGGDVTGIEGVSLTPALSTREGVTYNLQGQRVSSFNGYRGVVIKGGKKFIVK